MNVIHYNVSKFPGRGWHWLIIYEDAGIRFELRGDGGFADVFFAWWQLGYGPEPYAALVPYGVMVMADGSSVPVEWLGPMSEGRIVPKGRRKV